jgi:WD40 repeat protein
MDCKIRIFDNNNQLVGTLVGHTKGVISFSWLSHSDGSSPFLISGSWDGSAILWDLNTFQQVSSFGPHENGVHVLGLSNGLIATTSTGESVNGKPDNFHLRFWNASSGQLVGKPMKDHEGSIRSICAIPGFDGFVTTGNDGAVIIRAIDGHVIETLMHPLQDDGGPPFVLDW